MQTSFNRNFLYAATCCILVLGCGLDIALAAPPAAKKAPKKSSTTIVKNCKNATALVNLNERGSGTAFCVSKDGYFLTNRHVVESVEIGQQVELILNSGEKNEKAIKAKVIHRSEEEEVDLALLKAESAKDLVPLVLGDDSELVETASVIAFGFPFGRRLAGERQEFPNITVTTAKVSALRGSSDDLDAIQIDGAINPGCSGAPLVNESGQVVGVIFAGISLSGIALAVPVSKAKTYLQSPRAVLNVPEIPYSQRYETQHVTLEMFELTPSTDATTVELKISPEGAEPRTVEMQRKGSLYEASLKFFEKPAKAPALRLKVGVGRLTKEITIEDQSIPWGTRKLSLSECRLIERDHDMHLVRTIQGNRFAAAVAELPTVKWSELSDLQLSKADRIQIAVEGTSSVEIPYEVTVRRKDAVVTTMSGVIRCVNPPRHSTDEYSEDGDDDDPVMNSFTVDVLIDGRSTLVVTPGGLQWEHESNALPGVAEGDHTFVLINDRKWHVKWGGRRDGEQDSKLLPLKIGGLSHDVQLLSMRDRPNQPHNPRRGGIEVKSEPYGQEPTRITFNDPPDGGGIFRIHVSPKTYFSVPTPVSERTQPPTSAYWSFDNDTVDRIRDVTGNHHDGHGPAPLIVDGRIGKALALDGGNLNCGDIGNFDRTDAFSLGGWTFVNNTSVLNIIAARLDGRVGYRGYDLSVGERLYFHLLHDYNSGNGIKVFTAEKYKPFAWHHFFATYDGSGKSTGVRLYVDGIQADFVVEMDGLTETTKVGVPFRLGLRAPESSAAEPMHGRVDEIRLYNRVLTPDEVWCLATSSLPSGSPDEPKVLREKLVGLWTFDEPSTGSKETLSVRNSSGSGRPATAEFPEQNVAFDEGKFGKGLRLNNRVIQFTEGTGDFERTDAFSYGCWVRRTDKPNQSLFSKLEQRAPFRGWDLMIQNGFPRMSLNCAWDSGNTEPQRAIFVLGKTTVPPNEWHHVITTYDGSSKASGVTIYVDAKPIILEVQTDLLDGSIRTVTPLCLGNRFNDPNGAYDGLMDEAVIYNRCLTQQEVTDLVAGNLPKP